MAKERIHDEKVGSPPPGAEQAGGPPPGVTDEVNEPARELARDPHIHDADPTNQRADRTRRALEAEEELEDEPPLSRVTRPAAVPLARTPLTARDLDERAKPRPFSVQAEEGQRDALPESRAPYALAPPADTLGARHIEEAMRDLEFPITRADLLARAGDWRIPVTGRSFRTLREYLEGVDEDRFDGPHDVARAIKRHRDKWHR